MIYLPPIGLPPPRGWSYRPPLPSGGNYALFLAEMLERMPSQRMPDGSKPLARLNMSPRQNWTVGLVEAWALVGEVLSFYERRISEENYLPTASQDLSLRELIRSLGYESYPGVAPSAWLDFQAAPSMKQPIDLAQGSKVQSLPIKNQLPQLFETARELVVHAEWNQLTAMVPLITKPPTLLGSSTQAQLLGTRGLVKTGDEILIFGTAEVIAPRPRRVLRTVKQAKPTPKPPSQTLQEKNQSKSPLGGSRPAATTVIWDPPFDAKHSERRFIEPRILALRVRARLFGATSVLWQKVPLAQQREVQQIEGGVRIVRTDSGGWSWSSANDGLPAESVHALVSQRSGPLFAATAAGLYRSPPIPGADQAKTSTPVGTHWQALKTGLPVGEALALATGGRHEFFVGTAVGGVFRSADDGETWEPVIRRMRPSNSKQSSGSTSKQQIDSKRQTDSASSAKTSRGQKIEDSIEKAIESKTTDRKKKGGWLSWLSGIFKFFKDLGAISKIFQWLSSLSKALQGLMGLFGGPKPLQSLPRSPVFALASLTDGKTQELYAGTGKGVFRSSGPGSGWLPANGNLPGTDSKTGFTDLLIHALLPQSSASSPPNPEGLLAGTAKGVWFSSNAGKSWTRWQPDSESPDLAITSLVKSDDGYYASTAVGIFRTTDPSGRSWQRDTRPPAPNPLANTVYVTDVLSLAVGSGGLRVFAGTETGLFLRHGALDWREIPIPSTSPPMAPVTERIEALAAAAGKLFAASPFDGFPIDNWPDFRLNPGQPHSPGEAPGEIDLDKVYPQLVAGGWVVLSQSSDTTTPSASPPEPGQLTTLIVRIRKVLEIRRQDFGIDAMVTRLEVAPDPALARFDLRRTVALADSEEMPLWTPKVPWLKPVTGQYVEVEPALTEPLPMNRPVIVTGQPSRLLIKVAPSHVGFSAKEPLQLAVGDSVQVLRILNQYHHHDEQYQRLKVRDAEGKTGIISLPVRELEWQPALKDDDEIAEKTTVIATELTRFPPELHLASPPADSPPTASPPTGDDEDFQRVSRLTMQPALTQVFARETATVRANVAKADQGETVTETLGQGDASRVFQRFTLSKPPLTHVQATNLQGFLSTLKIQVQGVPWHQVPSIRRAAPGERAYMVVPDHSGVSSVVFGNGRRGARLPNGADVVATYRSGLSTQTVAAHQLSVLLTRPMGLRSADNPLPSTVSGLPEPLELSRSQAPMWTRPLNRIVSLSDYQEFAYAFSGIRRAVVSNLSTRRSPLVHLTIAGEDGAAVRHGDDLHRRLTQAIYRARIPSHRLRIDSYVPVKFAVTVQIVVNPSSQATTIEEMLRAALLTRFGFDNSFFGGMVTPFEIASEARKVDGVVAARSVSFNVAGQAGGLVGSLRAQPARIIERPAVKPIASARQPNRAVEQPEALFLPAELLLISPEDLKLQILAPSIFMNSELAV